MEMKSNWMLEFLAVWFYPAWRTKLFSKENIWTEQKEITVFFFLGKNTYIVLVMLKIITFFYYYYESAYPKMYNAVVFPY